MMGVFISRQVSRSPHSKHSQRRHSPYSSLETTRYVSMQFKIKIVLVFLRHAQPFAAKVKESSFWFLNCNITWFSSCANFLQEKEIKIPITCQATQMILAKDSLG
jgi:hypothetical protein